MGLSFGRGGVLDTFLLYFCAVLKALLCKVIAGFQLWLRKSSATVVCLSFFIYEVRVMALTSLALLFEFCG